MAITSLEASGSQANSASYQTAGNIAPSAGSIVFVVINGTRAAPTSTPSCSGLSATWDQVVMFNSGPSVGVIYRASFPSAPTAAKLTFTFSTTEAACCWVVFEITGFSTDSNGAHATIQVPTENNGSTSPASATAYTNAFSDSNNYNIGVMGTYLFNGTPTVPVAGSGFSVLAHREEDQGALQSDIGISVEYKVGSGTPDFTYTGSDNWVVFALEVGDPHTGEGAADLPAPLTMSGTGTHVANASGSGTPSVPSPLTAVATGIQSISGSGTPTLPSPLTASGIGIMQPSGTGSLLLFIITASGAGVMGALVGTGSPLIPSPLSAIGLGTHPYSGSGSPALPSPLQSLGEALQGIIAEGTPDLPAPLVAVGIGIIPPIGVGSPSLPAIIGSGSGTITIIGSGSLVVPSPLISTGTGILVPSGTGALILPSPIQSTGAGTVPPVGTGSLTLFIITAHGVGFIDVGRFPGLGHGLLVQPPPSASAIVVLSPDELARAILTQPPPPGHARRSYYGE